MRKASAPNSEQDGVKRQAPPRYVVPMVLYPPITIRPRARKSFANGLHSPIQRPDELIVGKPFVKAAVDRLEDDIDFRLRSFGGFGQTAEILPTPALQPISNDGRPDLAGSRHSKTKIAIGRGPKVQQEPLSGPQSAARFFQLKELRIPLQRLSGTTCHRSRRSVACALSRDDARELFDHLWWPCVHENRAHFCADGWKVGRSVS